LAFWLTETDALHSLLWAGLFIGGGQGIPLSFFSASVRGVLEMLPFAYIFSFPLEIFSGKLSVEEMIFGILKQLAWILLLALLYKFLWKRGTRAYQSFGG
jgi:ABC-2 type transport system permease protein